MNEDRQRVDKWLWFARVVKSRTLAAGLVTDGCVRLNRVRIDQAAKPVKVGDVLTIAVAGRVRVLKVAAFASRRGPASEAALLYEDLTEPASGQASAATDAANLPAVEATGPRPTKRDRRRFEALRS